MKIIEYKKVIHGVFYQHMAKVELAKEDENISKIQLIRNISKQKGYPEQGYGLYKPIYRKEKENVYSFKWLTEKTCD